MLKFVKTRAREIKESAQFSSFLDHLVWIGQVRRTALVQALTISLKSLLLFPENTRNFSTDRACSKPEFLECERLYVCVKLNYHRESLTENFALSGRFGLCNPEVRSPPNDDCFHPKHHHGKRGEYASDGTLQELGNGSIREGTLFETARMTSTPLLPA